MKWQDYLDENEIRKAIDILKPDGELFEVRVIKKSGRKVIISGYFTNTDDLISAFDTLDIRNTNVYLTINKVNDACYSREQRDCFRQTDNTTHDNEIDSYEWLFVDLDPVRITEVSSTREELEASDKVADKVYNYLKKMGFEEPIRALSGNGTHLLYKIDLPVSDENKALVGKCLEVLSAFFNTDKVKIDEVNKNPSRICKLYGTMAQKGANTSARPHRMSRITSAPDALKTNTREVLEGLAAELPDVNPKITKKTAAAFDLTDWMYQHGLEPMRADAGTNCTIYPLASCPFDHSHTDGDSKIFQYSDGAIAFKCHHNSCRGKKWQDVRELLEPGAYDNSDDDDRIEAGWAEHKKLKQYITVTKTENVEEIKKNLPKLKAISAYDLQDKEFGERYYAVQDMIPEGETVIAAPPKTGKSWLMLDMCLKVAQGKKFLGFDTTQSDTLYLALEDGDSFEQERLNIVMNGERAPKNFHFVFQNVMPMNEGFLLQLDELLKQFPDVKVVVVDTLQFVKYRMGKSESAYECDYRTGRDLKEYAEKHHISIVVVTHTTKAIHIEDDMANVSGTNGVTGAADSVIVLGKENRTDSDAKMFIVGRKVRQSMHTIRFDDSRCQWDYVGVATVTDKDKREREERERKFIDSNIRAAVLQIARSEETVESPWNGRAGDLIEKATAYKIGIRESNKEVGGFLSSMQGMFMEIDGVQLEKIDNGTASKIYRIYHSEKNEIPFE